MHEKKVRTRGRILDAATAALIRRGPREPSVGEVMGAAGLTVGGFYGHFESKEAFMLEAFGQLLARRRQLLRQLHGSLGAEARGCSSVAEALLVQCGRASEDDEILVFGSFYCVAEALEWLSQQAEAGDGGAG